METPEVRRRTMQAVKSENTGPELAVRRLTHSMGYRFRLHRKDLPGKPDLVFPRLRKVVFVHGCFWHAHGCKCTRVPKSNVDYWKPKLERNQARDGENVAELAASGWACLIVWECETADKHSLKKRLETFLEGRMDLAAGAIGSD